MILENKLKNISLILTIIILMQLLNSCKTQKSEVKQEATDISKPTPTNNNSGKYQNSIKAIITQLDLDGCTWIILLEDGKRLEPVNLAEEFKVANLDVMLQYTHADGNSICMAGEMVTITYIAKR